jgi:hypothetical protein
LNIRLERIDCNSFAKHINICKFPFRIGRSKKCHHRIEAKGVWPFHIVLELDGENGIIVKSESDALLLINSLKASKAVRLQNGDLLQFGAIQNLKATTPNCNKSPFCNRTAFEAFKLLMSNNASDSLFTIIPFSPSSSRTI